MEWAEDIVDWYRTKRGQVTVTYRGMFSEPDVNGVRTEISVYYFLRTQFDPLAPRRPGTSEVGRGFPLITEEEQTQQAEQNRSLYELYLTWPRIKRNLLSNMFETKDSLAQIDVHYRFLSAHVIRSRSGAVTRTAGTDRGRATTTTHPSSFCSTRSR